MLTDKQCKNASCDAGRPRVRLADSGGLYLEVSPSGSKRWFWKYRFDGKEKRLALGGYPDLGLKEARVARDDARKQHQSGADPVLTRQVERLSSRFDANASFEVTAREFHATKKVGWSDHYAKRWMERLEKDIFPWLGKLPLSQIGAPMLLQTLRRVEARGTRELPHSLLEACGQVFRYGVATGRCERSPASDLRGALKPVLTRHVSAIVEPDQVGDLMRAIDGYHGHPVTRAALLLSALLFQRPGNIRQMEWAELDLVERMWAIPALRLSERLQFCAVAGARAATDVLLHVASSDSLKSLGSCRPHKTATGRLCESVRPSRMRGPGSSAVIRRIDLDAGNLRGNLF